VLRRKAAHVLRFGGGWRNKQAVQIEAWPAFIRVARQTMLAREGPVFCTTSCGWAPSIVETCARPLPEVAMVSIRRILVPVDFSECSRNAFALGAELARSLTARLTALHVYPYYVPTHDWALGTGEPPWTDSLERVEEQLRRFVTPTGADAPLAEGIVCTGEPVPEILSHAGDVDLIVVGTHGRRGFERWTVGSVADGLARKAACPVLVVPPHANRTTIERVLCGVDLGATSAETLEYAGVVAEATRARLLVMHVVELTSAYEPWTLYGEDEAGIRRSIAASAEERLEGFVAEHVSPGVSVDVKVVIGPPRRELERAVRDGVDMAVVGAHSTGAIQRLFFGSTADHLLRGDVCPVLFVRAPGPARRAIRTTEDAHAGVR
jgi:nucleotide-binding universal stress UspA family protein